jgi:hypothetical protein
MPKEVWYQKKIRELEEQLAGGITSDLTQFPPEAVWIATGKALVARHKGNGINAEGQITDQEGNAWTAMIDPRGTGIKLSRREKWNDGEPKCSHWLIPHSAFDNLSLAAEPIEMESVTEIAAPLYVYRTVAGETITKDFKGTPPLRIKEGFEQTEKHYQLVGPAA